MYCNNEVDDDDDGGSNKDDGGSNGGSPDAVILGFTGDFVLVFFGDDEIPTFCS